VSRSRRSYFSPAARRTSCAYAAARWGIQLATDFDFTKGVQEKDYYLGVAWEPIAGFGLGAGVAMVRGQFIPPVAGPPQDNYILRPYIGVFLTPDFITSAKAAATELTQ
jgi:hypothetical protein